MTGKSKVTAHTDPAPLSADRAGPDVDEVSVEDVSDDAGEVERLRDEVARLRAENEELRAAGAGAGAGRPAPRAPSFGMSEGERADLEAAQARRTADLKAGVPASRAARVETTSPFTGERVTPADVPPGPRVHGTD